MFLLELSRHSNFVRRQISIMIYRSENPANFLQLKSTCDQVSQFLVRIIQYLKTVRFTNLRWLINSFYNRSYSIRIIRIFSIISIHNPYSLLHMMRLLPISDKTCHLRHIHELHIINMSIRLSSQHSSGWHTRITNT